MSLIRPSHSAIDKKFISSADTPPSEHVRKSIAETVEFKQQKEKEVFFEWWSVAAINTDDKLVTSYHIDMKIMDSLNSDNERFDYVLMCLFDRLNRDLKTYTELNKKNKDAQIQ